MTCVKVSCGSDPCELFTIWLVLWSKMDQCTWSLFLRPPSHQFRVSAVLFPWEDAACQSPLESRLTQAATLNEPATCIDGMVTC